MLPIDNAKEIIESVLLSFIPIFVAIDPIGIIPMSLHSQEGMDIKANRRSYWIQYSRQQS